MTVTPALAAVLDVASVTIILIVLAVFVVAVTDAVWNAGRRR